jgi:Spy/CpxP family protein refolding chaperone
MVFTGPGRHRRPTQTERAVVAATVAGAGLALPLLAATGAHADPGTAWDAVAQCETNGNWSQDSGNGFYGGLHLSQRQWDQYGGDEYGAEPSHATREQQIEVAKAILEDKGPGTWGNCAVTAGLAGQGSAPAAAPSAAPSTPVTVPTDPATGAVAATPAPTQTGSAPATPNAPTPTTPAPSAAAPSAPATPAAGTPVAGTPTPAAPSQSSAPQHPQATPTPAAPTTPSAPSTSATPATPGAGSPAPAAPSQSNPQQPATGGYTVQPGDNLSEIAYTHHLDGWQQFYQHNVDVVGANPNLILPGQQLQFP